ncbi:hypothetical protein HYALB_00004770 [Hymenoscyphus albidus]|uniref:Uncharacterized protein n=1 Tax=Hymenoscyphus albidus TaxID=595503 RepID=A0A9N9LPY3_9HELO|nr:hypothetical protein HYALB_00004770 [Hymenoscyphus albidus]
MADPFSILAGTAGLTDVCIRLAQFLKHANDGFRVVDQELEALSEEITSLRSVNDLIERSYTEGSTAKANLEHQKILGTNWHATQNTLVSCQRIVEKIEEILIEVEGSGGGKHIKRDQIRKWLKQQRKEEELMSLREKLKAHQKALQLSLSAVNIFWGVFWINATSKEHAEQSFSTIGKVAPNQAAVKSWFSTLGPDHPWLLIIDNADDDNFPVQDCFPDSTSGTILITTRNPMLRTHGIVVPRYFEFHGLDEEKSIELLLNALGESIPWKATNINFASVIAKAMGYLPLALIHAGATVLSGQCTLETYLNFFEATWDRIRQIKEPTAATPISDTNAAIYSSFELMHDGISMRKNSASKDALELLRIFSFLDRQQIKLEIFLRAATNPTVESAAELRKEGDRKVYSKSIPKLTKAQTLRNIIMRLLNLLSQLGHRPVLPKFLSQSIGPEAFYELRLREEIKELSRMSLISTNSGIGDCYSMHAAVHLWARQRPDMTLVEQAPRVTPDRLVQLVKFSLVYAQGHQLEEAERLRSYVANIAIQYLGVENMKTINIMRLLSWTYWQLARPDKAVELQKQALQACIKVLGPENPETLQIMDSYGSSLWLQGHVPEARNGGLGRAVGKDFDFTEAIDIQSKAFIGLRVKLGPSHTATLEAMDNLAMAYFDRAAYRQGQPNDLERALALESEVFTTRVKRLGRENYHNLWAGLNLARIKGVCGETDEALSIFLPGHSVVRRDLGEDHFIYLFSELHHGRILMCAKRYDEAERILTSVVDSHEKNRGQHPDRLLAMFSLIKCRNVLDKSNQTSALLYELISGTKALFGPDHAAFRCIIDGQVLSKDASEILLDNPTKGDDTNSIQRGTGHLQNERNSYSSVVGERIQPILNEELQFLGKAEKKTKVFDENVLRSRGGKESLKGKNKVRDDDDK